MENYAIRIRRNDRLSNHPKESDGWKRAMERFVREFQPEKFLNWEAVPWEGNFGPGPSWTWYSGSSPTTTFKTVNDAREFWLDRGMPDLVVDIVSISYKTVTTL